MKLNKIATALVLANLCVAPLALADTLYPQDFGGAPDNKTLNTTAIQSAIDECAKAGGGEVRLTEGVWLSGPLSLKSNVTLNITKGATLKADNSKNDFVAAYIGKETAANEAFLLGNNVENVVITGSGTIDGSGDKYWWDEALEVRKAVKSGNTAEFEKRFPNVKLANGMPRPWLIELNKVDGAMIYGVNIQNSPMWNVVLRNSNRVGVDGVKITAPVESPNTDGIDIVSSQQVSIRNVDIFTGDDNVAVKSGVDQNGAQASADIVIENSVMHAGHGVSIGSETANGIGEVNVRNLTFDETENGIRIKSARDRGNNIGPLVVNDIKMEKVQTPILITCSYAGQSGAGGMTLVEPLESAKVTKTTPYIKGAYINNLTATDANIAVLLSGLPESHVKDVHLENVKIDSKLGVQARYVEGSLKNVEVKVKEGESVVKGPEVKLTQE